MPQTEWTPEIDSNYMNDSATELYSGGGRTSDQAGKALPFDTNDMTPIG
jgi:hypothetical protein